MRDYECANLIADVVAFYPEIRDPLALASSYYLLLVEFEEEVAREAFMRLVRNPATKYFPRPGEVYELCRELSRKKPQPRALPWRNNWQERNDEWLEFTRSDYSYRATGPDEQLAIFAKFFFPDKAESFFKNNFLDFEYIRMLNEPCMNCQGKCRRNYAAGCFATARLEKGAEYVMVFLLPCLVALRKRVL